MADQTTNSRGSHNAVFLADVYNKYTIEKYVFGMHGLFPGKSVDKKRNKVYVGSKDIRTDAIDFPPLGPESQLQRLTISRASVEYQMVRRGARMVLDFSDIDDQDDPVDIEAECMEYSKGQMMLYENYLAWRKTQSATSGETEDQFRQDGTAIDLKKDEAGMIATIDEGILTIEERAGMVDYIVLGRRDWFKIRRKDEYVSQFHDSGENKKITRAMFAEIHELPHGADSVVVDSTIRGGSFTYPAAGPARHASGSRSTITLLANDMSPGMNTVNAGCCLRKDDDIRVKTVDLETEGFDLYQVMVQDRYTQKVIEPNAALVFDNIIVSA